MSSLSEPITISFEANRLTNVMDYFQEKTGFPIDVDWPSLEKWNVPKDELITLDLIDVPVSRAIELTVHEAAGGRLAVLIDRGERLHVTMNRNVEQLLKGDPERWTIWHAVVMPVSNEQPSPHVVTEDLLSKDIPWNFEENRVENILNYIKLASDVNMYIDLKYLEKKGIIKYETVFTGTGEPKPASEVLETVLAGTSECLAWRIDDFGIVIISTREVIGRMFPSPDEAGDTGAGAPE